MNSPLGLLSSTTAGCSAGRGGAGAAPGPEAVDWLGRAGAGAGGAFTIWRAGAVVGTTRGAAGCDCGAV
jgi:hypothetical protein